MSLNNDKFVYLIFSKTGTLISTILSAALRHKYSHISISLDPSLNKMYSFGRLKLNNPLIGGLVEENIHAGIFKKFTYSQCLIYRLKVSPEQYNLLKKELDYFLNEKDKYKYNFLGVFTAYWDKPFEKDYYYFCSQFVSELLIKSNIYINPKPSATTTPIDLLNIANMEFVYEGYTNLYDSYEQPVSVY